MSWFVNRSLSGSLMHKSKNTFASVSSSLSSLSSTASSTTQANALLHKLRLKQQHRLSSSSSSPTTTTSTTSTSTFTTPTPITYASSSSASSASSAKSATKAEQYDDKLFEPTVNDFESSNETLSFSSLFARKMLMINDENVDTFVNKINVKYPEVGSPSRVSWVDENGQERFAYGNILPQTVARAGFNINDVTVEPASAPSIGLRFMDAKGNQHDVKAWEGENLLDVCKRENLSMPGSCGGMSDDEDRFGDGPMCPFCHCYVATEYLDKLPPASPVEREAVLVPNGFGVGEYTKNSRLACQIKLTKDLDGMSVYIPRYPPHKLV